MSKICIKCREEKELNQFYKDKTREDGYTKKCKICCSSSSINYYFDNKERYQKYFKQKEVKNKLKEYKLKNREELLIYNKDYYNNNKDYFETYYKENKEEIISKACIRQKIRHKTDINFKLMRNIRVRIYHALKDNSKSKNTEKLLGCTAKECCKYLESQFKPEMNWNNHGKIWEIDHIIPCSRFDLSKNKEQEKCFHYSNLQPKFKTTKIAEQLGYLDEIGNRNKSNK